MPVSTAIFWPVIAQVLLVHLVYFLMARRRFGAVRSGAAKKQDYLIPTIEPAASATVARSLINQFELPLLFLIVCTLLYITAGANTFAVIIAWLFVLSRYVHAFVHVTSNRLMVRQRLFSIGFVLNFILWVWFSLHIAGIA